MILLVKRRSATRIATLLLATLAIGGLSSNAHAQINVYRANTEAGGRHNPLDPNTITYTTAFIALSGAENALDITNLQYGVRRLSSGGFLTAVNVEVYVAEMTWDGANYGIGAPNLVGTETLTATASAGSTTQVINVFYPPPLPRPLLLLETQSQAGFGGLFLGMRFVGANATNGNNGWRNVNTPTVGQSLNAFFEYNISSSTLSAPLTSSPTIGNGQFRLYSTVVGNILVVPEANTGLLALLGLAPVAGMLIAKRCKKS